MFDYIKDGIFKNKNNRKLTRKLTELLVRINILHLINRVFKTDQMDKNFEIYFSWAKDKYKSL